MFIKEIEEQAGMRFNFENYLCVVEGIHPEYFDNNYDGIMADEISERYEEYDLSDWAKDVRKYEEYID